jgi:2-haloacid dehalogenase
MKPAEAVKALVFDAYGTIFDVHSIASLCEEMFPGQGSALSQLWRVKQLEYTWLRTLMGRYEDFFKVTESALIHACKTLKLGCSAPARADLMDAYLHLAAYPNTVDTLRKLYGRPLAILSNGTPHMLHSAVSSANLDAVFGHVISVDEVKAYKPSPQVYQLAPNKLRVPVESIGFVSSNSWDVAGAASFGFTAFWVNRSGQPMDELGVTPAKVLTDLTQLLE